MTVLTNIDSLPKGYEYHGSTDFYDYYVKYDKSFTDILDIIAIAI